MSATSGYELGGDTHYIAGFQYRNDELQFFPTAEGYVNVTDGGKFNYVYNYTDHLGNIRLSYTKDPATGVLKILEQSHYYPYGMKHANYNDSKHDYGHEEGGIFAIIKPVIRSNYQYKYNGKEYQDELGLNVTAMDFRQYDNAIGRFTGMDALSEIMFSQNPYHFSCNNPIIFSDPSGLMVIGQGNSPVDTMWNQTATGTSSFWRNDGSGFGNVTGSGYITYDNKYFGLKVNLKRLL